MRDAGTGRYRLSFRPAPQEVSAVKQRPLHLRESRWTRSANGVAGSHIFMARLAQSRPVLADKQVVRQQPAGFIIGVVLVAYMKIRQAAW